MKRIYVIATALAVSCLTGCFGGKGSGGDSEAIDLAKGQNIISVNSKTMVNEGVKMDIGIDEKYGEWDNSYLFLTTKQTVLSKESGKTYTVDISWSYESASFVREKVAYDETHEKILFNYSTTEEYDFKINAELKCGSATGTASYEVHLQKNNLKFDDMKISGIYELNEGNNGYKLVETSGESEGYYKSNNLPVTKKCYVQTYGRVVYTAPDGDWALIADGNDVLELFAGSGAANLKPSEFPALTVGKTVKVMGALSSYFGNAQMQFVKDIVEVDSSKAAAASDFRSITGDQFDGKKYYEPGLVNSLRVVSATYAGNIKQGSVSDASKLTNGRFTFDVKVNDKTLTVAYDYHVDRNGDLNIFSAYKTKLQSLSMGAALTIKGTFRFAGKVETSYKGNEVDGSWTIVPWAADHIA